MVMQIQHIMEEENKSTLKRMRWNLIKLHSSKSRRKQFDPDVLSHNYCRSLVKGHCVII